MCGNCKKHAVELTEKLLTDLQEKRKAVGNNIKDFLE